MKNIHGNILLLIALLTSLSLQAKEHEFCSYSIESSAKELYVNEALHVHFKSRQKIHDEVMFFDLKPKKSDDYDIVLLNEKRHEFNYHDAKKTFDFLVTPKKAGSINIVFDFQVRRASDEGVAQAYTGSRDNVKSIPTVNTHIDTPTVSLHVKPHTKNIQAVGDFSLSMKLDKSESNSYDALNVVYTLDGTGYLDETFEPIKSIDNTSIFKGKKERPTRLSKEGYIYHKEWSYAIVASNNYTLDSIHLNYFNPKTQSYKSSITEAKNITIKQLDISTLIDDKEAPISTIEFKNYVHYLYYILFFVAGFLGAKLQEYLPEKFKRSESELCCQSIKKSSTPQDTLKAIMPFMNQVDIKNEVSELESAVYSNTHKINLQKIKTSIISKLEKVH